MIRAIGSAIDRGLAFWDSGAAMGKTELERSYCDVTAGGHRLRVQRIAPHGSSGKGGPTLVFLHEGLGSIGQWKGFPSKLCRALGLPAIVYDRWGFGASEPLVLPRPRDYLQQEAELVLPEVLADCGVERPVLIGHSDGGSIALLYAAAFPDRPLACITEAAHVFVEAISLAGIRQAVTLWQESDLPLRLARYHGDQAETVFRGWADTWLRPDFRDWNMIACLPAIACPLLAIQGVDDHYGSPLQVETIVTRSAGPAEALMLPACGHNPHHEAETPTLLAMAEFVRRTAN